MSFSPVTVDVNSSPSLYDKLVISLGSMIIHWAADRSWPSGCMTRTEALNSQGSDSHILIPISGWRFDIYPPWDANDADGFARVYVDPRGVYSR